jgi:hypothetical protein
MTKPSADVNWKKRGGAVAVLTKAAKMPFLLSPFRFLERYNTVP